MSESFETLELSAVAEAQKRAMLPGLLTAVKHRRRRRRTMRGVAAGALLVLVAVSVRGLWNSNRSTTPDRVQPEARAPSWSTFADDPTTIERCVVATTTRREWFIDDDGLNALLQQAGRRSGIVRAGGRVEVNRSAIDAWPAPGDE